MSSARLEQLFVSNPETHYEVILAQTVLNIMYVSVSVVDQCLFSSCLQRIFSDVIIFD